jgi:hypothetical protein
MEASSYDTSAADVREICGFAKQRMMLQPQLPTSSCKLNVAVAAMIGFWANSVDWAALGEASGGQK